MAHNWVYIINHLLSLNFPLAVITRPCFSRSALIFYRIDNAKKLPALLSFVRLIVIDKQDLWFFQKMKVLTCIFATLPDSFPWPLYSVHIINEGAIPGSLGDSAGTFPYLRSIVWRMALAVMKHDAVLWIKCNLLTLLRCSPRVSLSLSELLLSERWLH